MSGVSASYILSRFLHAIPTLLVLLAFVFYLVRLTGDPAQLYLGDLATPEALAALRASWGLDRPVFIQFVDYIQGVVRGDLGQSLRYTRPVTDLILERFPASLSLAVAALTLAVAVALPLGIVSALNRGKWIDNAIRFVTVVGQAVPRFYLAILFIVFFGLYLRLLPTSGSGTWRHLILPAIALSTPTMALLSRLTRATVLDVINQDYIRTARAKGLASARIQSKHVLRNALLAPFTVITIQFSQLIGGSVVIETVFGWPGLGQLAMQSVYTRDFVLIQGIVLVLTLLVIIVNILTDLMYGLIDPRIRYR